MNKRFQVVIVTLSTCVVTLLLLGTALVPGRAAEDAYRHFAVFSEVISKIKSDYVQEPDMKNVALGALNGMLESLDPFASYLNAEQYKSYLKSKETKKGDVGLVLSRRVGYVSVVAAIPGSPADKLGLNTGDVLETIAGIGTRDMPLAYAEVLLAGDPGTSVELDVLRVRQGAEAQKMALVRAPIQIPQVTAKMLQDGIGYVKAPSLETGKSKDVASKIAELKRQGAKKLVLDLRGNASGSVEEGVALADLFLDKGLIGYVEGQRVSRRNFEAASARSTWTEPLVLITNRGTSSGAEVAAAALLDNKRAEIVGERTYGEAAQRRAVTMDDGSAVILAVAKYYSPAGKSIPDNAVTPSLPVSDQDAQSDDDDTDTPAPPRSGEDMPLKKAVEVLTVGLAAAKDSDRNQQAGPARTGSEDRPLTIGPTGVPQPK